MDAEDFNDVICELLYGSCVLVSTRSVIALYGALVSLIVVPSANGYDQHNKPLVNNLVDQPIANITKLDFVGVLQVPT